MKTPTLIIFNLDTVDIEKAVNAKLAPYKQIEDPFKSGKWDYWTIFEENKFINENRPKNLYSSREELILCTNYISALEENFYNIGAIIDLEGKWHEQEDFGWTMINRNNKNEEGLKLWRKHVSDFIKNSEGLLGVIITTHI